MVTPVRGRRVWSNGHVLSDRTLGRLTALKARLLQVVEDELVSENWVGKLGDKDHLEEPLVEIFDEVITQSLKDIQNPFQDAEHEITSKLKIFLFLDHPKRLTSTGLRYAAYLYHGLVLSLTMLSVAMFLASTVTGVYTPSYQTADTTIEIIITVFLFLELIVRVWVCPSDPSGLFDNTFVGRLQYLKTFKAVVDIVAIIPIFSLFFKVVATGRVRIPFDGFRQLRLARLLKFERFVRASHLVYQVVRSKVGPLIITVMMSGFVLLVSATLMYYAERDAQPDVFPSVVHALWWSVITLTTIGYGDVYPITPWGKLIGGVTAFIAVGLFALPAGIISSSLLEEIEKRRNASRNSKLLKHLQAQHRATMGCVRSLVPVSSVLSVFGLELNRASVADGGDGVSKMNQDSTYSALRHAAHLIRSMPYDASLFCPSCGVNISHLSTLFERKPYKGSGLPPVIRKRIAEVISPKDANGKIIKETAVKSDAVARQLVSILQEYADQHPGSLPEKAPPAGGHVVPDEPWVGPVAASGGVEMNPMGGSRGASGVMVGAGMQGHGDVTYL